MMKAIRYLLTILVVTISGFAAMAQNSIIDEITDMNGVSSIYISKTMLSKMKPSMIGDKRIAAIAHELSSITIIEIEKVSTNTKIAQKISQLKSSPELELLTKIKDNGENTSIYAKQQGEKISMVILLVEEKKDINIIVLTGNISLKSISALTD